MYTVQCTLIVDVGDFLVFPLYQAVYFYDLLTIIIIIVTPIDSNSESGSLNPVSELAGKSGLRIGIKFKSGLTIYPHSHSAKNP